MEVKIGVTGRKDSNERERECFVVLEGVHCWGEEGGVCDCARERIRFEIRLLFTSNDLWNDDNK